MLVDDAVDEADLPHQLVGTEVVRPDFHRYFDVAVAVGIALAADVEEGATQDVARLDVGRLPAEMAHLRARIALVTSLLPQRSPSALAGTASASSRAARRRRRGRA